MVSQHNPTSEQDLSQEIRLLGANLAHRLSDLVEAGGDPHAAVQAMELFIRTVIRDCFLRARVQVGEARE